MRTQTTVALLTGGHDATYAHGLVKALTARGVRVDVIGSDLIDAPFLHESNLIRFLNLRGEQAEDAPAGRKVLRLGRYYWRLIKYAVRSDARVFHVLWNNRIELLDRTLMMLLYRLCGRHVVMTVHNVNAARRDDRDNWLNRRTLQMQYSQAKHLFVHTTRMRNELSSEFGMPESKISVIPFGINDEVPRSSLTGADARQRLGIASRERVALLFGQIAPYKGIEQAVIALPGICRRVPEFRLVIAGKIKRGHVDYWREIEARLSDSGFQSRVLARIEYIPDHDIELYFKAADVLLLPYLRVFQSGLPFLAYNFGLPVVCSNAGSLTDDVEVGVTGFVCNAGDPSDLERAVSSYFSSSLFATLAEARSKIRELALIRHSWHRVAEITTDVYESCGASPAR